MAKKNNAETATRRISSIRTGFRYAVVTVGLAATAMGAMFAMSEVEQYLTRDPRFILPPPPDYDQESAHLQVTGVQYASRSRIQHVFAGDFGKSLYFVPVAERRRNLLEVDWVKNVAVLRLWPNRLVVHVEERTPVAFVRMPGQPVRPKEEPPSRYVLIDADGVYLEPHAPARFTVPVLTGIAPGAEIDVRRDRVRKFTRMMAELGELGEKISEVDVSDPESLRLTLEVGSRAVVLIMGNQRFLPRLTNFLNHYEDIQKRLPDSTVLDLRLEDRITAVAE
ncbi:MAG: cell division protein FtsQ/DivIB [Bryobacteraceae bacterium]